MKYDQQTHSDHFTVRISIRSNFNKGEILPPPTPTATHPAPLLKVFFPFQNESTVWCNEFNFVNFF